MEKMEIEKVVASVKTKGQSQPMNEDQELPGG
jgi:hypothetical protein